MEQKKKRRAWNKKEPSYYEELLRKSKSERVKRLIDKNNKKEWRELFQSKIQTK